MIPDILIYHIGQIYMMYMSKISFIESTTQSHGWRSFMLLLLNNYFNKIKRTFLCFTAVSKSQEYIKSFLWVFVSRCVVTLSLKTTFFVSTKTKDKNILFFPHWIFEQRIWVMTCQVKKKCKISYYSLSLFVNWYLFNNLI